MGKVEVADADLAQYFDTIPHQRLWRQIARRVRDGSILKLIRSWLRAPVEEEGESGERRLRRNERGTPQGGVISPLLANLYLHPLDEAVNEGCRLRECLESAWWRERPACGLSDRPRNRKRDARATMARRVLRHTLRHAAWAFVRRVKGVWAAECH